MFRPLPFLLAFMVFSCTGNNFDETAFPENQRSTLLAFKRLQNHGNLEPVLEVGQQLNDWQFHVRSFSKSSSVGQEPVLTYQLEDVSGISYAVSSADTPAKIINRISSGTYGFATGEVIGVDRDLVAGAISVQLRLDDWVENKE